MFWLVAEILIALALAVVIVAWTMSGRRRSEAGATHAAETAPAEDNKRSGEGRARLP
ncbi:MAG: hypothetical protein U1F25_19025 [Rubrivivax sp.]